MFLFFTQMKNEEHKKEEGILKEKDGSNAQGWTQTYKWGIWRERGIWNQSEGGNTFFLDLETVTS